MRYFSRLRILAVLVSVLMLAACSNSAQDAEKASGTAGALASDEVAVFRTISLEGGDFSSIARVLHSDAEAARKDPGNITFDVYRPIDGSSNLLLFERWKSRTALEHYAYGVSGREEARALEHAQAESSVYDLKEIPPSGSGTRRAPRDPASEYDVFVVFNVRPDREQDFVKAWQALLPHVRALPQNAVFELYKDVKVPHTYVLIERWDSAQGHDDHLLQPYSLALDKVLPGTLALQVVNDKTRFVARSISASGGREGKAGHSGIF